ncbi:MAG: hypothetical protein BGO99_07490 [Nitrosospira sp. 56-18]|nr:MAG: hypothetical protein BGO99_07490 [Nitrosospira sp. 56-18]
MRFMRWTSSNRCRRIARYKAESPREATGMIKTGLPARLQSGKSIFPCHPFNTSACGGGRAK